MCGTGKAAKEFRTSSQYFLPTTKDPMLEKIDRRVQYLTRIPISHAEYIQVLRYNHMEHYSAHHDFFDPAAYASSPDMLASVTPQHASAHHGAITSPQVRELSRYARLGRARRPEPTGHRLLLPEQCEC